MRSVFALGCCLLLLVLLGRLDGELDRAPLASSAPDGGIGVIAFARGALLPPAEFPGGTAIVDDAILIGDKILRYDDKRQGLRVAVLDEELEFDGHENFDLAASSDDAEELRELCDEQGIGAVLVLASFGRLLPGDDYDAQQRDALEQTFALLGAELPPIRTAYCSWAMLSVRTPQGWRRLSESYSEQAGAVVTYTLHAGLARDERGPGELSIAELRGDVRLPLSFDVTNAEVEGGIVKSLRYGLVDGQHRRSIMTRPLRHTSEDYCSLLWRDVSLGREPVLVTGAGLQDAEREGSAGAILCVLVDGEELERIALVGDPLPRAWSDHRIDLASYADQSVDIELRTWANGTRCVALWGDPTLEFQR